METGYSQILQILLIAIGVIFGIITLLAILSKIKGPGVVKRPPEVKSRPGSIPEKPQEAGEQNQLASLRFGEGVEASLEQAHTLQTIKVKELVEIGILDDPEEEKKLRAELDLITEYIKNCESNKFKSKESLNGFFQLMKNISDGGGDKIAFFYKFGIQLNRYLEERDFQLILELFSQASQKLLAVKSKENQLNILLRNLQILIRKFEENHDVLELEKKAKQEGLENLIREIKNCLNEIEKINLSQGNKKGVLPEVKFFNNQLKELLNQAREQQKEVLDKPSFSIQLIPKKETLSVTSTQDDLRLNFLISNLNHKAAPVKRIRVKPECNSNDMEYEGGKKMVELNNKGEKTIDFTFGVYFLGKTSQEPNPTIEFKILYRYNEQEYKDEEEVALPKIQVRQTIENPYEEGYSGGGLPGTSPLFVGRREVLREISANLEDFGKKPNFYLICSLPRTGKTSVLKQFQENPLWLKEKYLPIYSIGRPSRDPEYFFRDLYEGAKSTLQFGLDIHIKTKDSHKKKRPDEPSWQRIIDLLRSNENEIKKEKVRILFLIDEYQVFAQWEEGEIIDNVRLARGYIYYQFPEFIKAIFDQYREVATVILAGYQTLTEVGMYNHHFLQQLGGRIKQKVITNFSDKEADELVTDKFNRYGLQIGEEHLEHIRNYTFCHPYLHMLLSYHLFKQMLDGDQFRKDKSVTVTDIDRAAQEIGGEDLKFMWTEQWVTEKKETPLFLASLAELSYKAAKECGNYVSMPELSIEVIQDHLYREYDIRFDESEFLEARRTLCDYGIVSAAEKEGCYKLNYPLFALFVNKHQILKQVVKNFRNTAV